MTCRPKPKKALWTKTAGLKPNGWRRVSKKRIQLLKRVASKCTKLKQWRPMKPRSKRYASRMTIYARLAAAFLRQHPCCVVCRSRKATDCHHWAGRQGKLLLDERLWLAVCRRCHGDIHNYPNWARLKNLLAPAGVWNDYGRAVKTIKASLGR